LKFVNYLLVSKRQKDISRSCTWSPILSNPWPRLTAPTPDVRLLNASLPN